MGLLDGKLFEPAERPEDVRNKWLVVIVCVILSVLYSLWLVRQGLAGRYPEQALAEAFGSTVASLILPTLVGLIARLVKVRKWHYFFASTFGVVLVLSALGRATHH